MSLSDETPSGQADRLSHNSALAQGSLSDLLIEREIRQARLAALKAGPISSRLEPLSPEQLEAPIDVVADDMGESEEAFPQIEGYLVLAEIGSGGQGVVYKAVQESTGRKVALKVLAGGRGARADRRERFEREAGILASLDHPNIVSIIDRGRAADGTFFIAVQYVDGCGLEEHLRARGRAPSLVVPLLAKIAEAVGEAHRHGIVHRDIKPSNILVDLRGEPHVADFGLARLEEEPEGVALALTQTGQILGSLPWLSPEQARGAAGRADARSDVYALGVVFYHALTGEFPYPINGSTRELLTNIETIVPSPPSRKAVLYDDRLDAVVLKALSKDPANRYASAAEFAKDLDSVMSGRRPSAAPHPLPSWRWRRLSSYGLALAVAGSAASLLLIGGCLGSRHRTGVAAEASIVSFGGPGAAPQSPRINPEEVQGARRLPLSSPTTKDAPEVNSVGMRLVRLPRGQFVMGSPRTEAGRYDDEDEHVVFIGRDIWMSATEVTQGQYERVMRRREWDPQLSDVDFPADNITWHQAVAFCAKLSRLEGARYRLPTEAEWEYACRAGSTGAFGGSLKLDEAGWHRGNAADGVRRVATKASNPWGMYDTHGNVREWCSDSYGFRYPPGPVQDPTGPLLNIHRVLRGGGIDSGWQHCRAASRTARDPDVAGRGIGFRVVLDRTTQHAVAD